MPLLLASLALFITLHSVPAIPAIRTRLIAWLGRGIYFTLYSIASTAVLVLVFWSAFQLDYVPLWVAARWQAWVTLISAPLGLFLVLGGLISANPFSVTLRRQTEKRGAIVSITRHPVPMGFALWAFGHIVPNGDLRSLILFGIFGLFSLGGVAMQESRARRRLGATFEPMARGTSIWPFVSWISGSAKPRLDRPLAVAAAMTAAITFVLLAGLHAMLIGVDPLALAAAY